MNPSTIILIAATCCLLLSADDTSAQQQNHRASLARILRPLNETSVLASTTSPVTNSSLANNPNPLKANETRASAEKEDEEEDSDDEDDDGEEDDDDEYEIEGEDEDEDIDVADSSKNATNAKIVTDVFGNKLKLENNRTVLIGQSNKRGLGMLTLKAILLGPLIGITIKHALLRGLIWAVGAYLIHLFFPTLLTSMGLGTGLVGFARQIQPDYSQMLAPHLANLQNQIPPSFRQTIAQYRQVLEPVVESIRSIPEGQCRYRAVCELAGHVSRQARSMNTTLQRISATVYLNFGTEYSKAWLDGIVVGTDCGVKYLQCPNSPLSMVANRLAETLRQRAMPVMMQQAAANAAAAAAAATPAAPLAAAPAIPVAATVPAAAT